MRQLTINPPRLHPSQLEVADHPARFRVLACGRRWGKTRLGAAECVGVAVRGGRSWWVAPSYKVANVGWRLITRLALQIPGAEIRKADRVVALPSGGEVSVRSADNSDSLRGEGLDFVVLDECAFMRSKAWYESLRPALSDRRGRAMFISTPKGRNWFWHLFQQGQAGTTWRSWSLPTADNPFIDAAEIEAARAGLPERIFRQEYLAEFIEDGGGVFRGVMRAVDGDCWQDEPLPAHQYIMGVDWGKHSDFTVLTVIDVTLGHVCHIDRFNQIDYSFQVQRLQVLADKFQPAQIIAEQNSMGDPIIEQLRIMQLPVTPFVTTNATKKAAIEALSLAFERDEIRIPDDAVLIGELQAFESERLPSGNIRYGAPDGMHDDTVMSLAIGWSGMGGAQPYGDHITISMDNYKTRRGR
jgi:phage FluMu gp28-like protein